MRMKTLVSIGLVLILVLTTLAGCTSGAGSSIYTTNQQEGIWVNGHGEVNAAPDIAILQLGIAAQRASVAEATPTTPISPGEMKVSLDVQVVYAILD
jgi:uncharacterized protein YggE